MSNGLKAAYDSLLALGILKRDHRQEHLVERLQKLHENIQDYEPYRPGMIGKVRIAFLEPVFKIIRSFIETKSIDQPKP